MVEQFPPGATRRAVRSEQAVFFPLLRPCFSASELSVPTDAARCAAFRRSRGFRFFVSLPLLLRAKHLLVAAIGTFTSCCSSTASRRASRAGDRRDERRVERLGGVAAGRCHRARGRGALLAEDEPVPQNGPGIVRAHGVMRP